MSIVDDRILEYLSEVSEFGSPSEIHREGNLPYTREYVAERCRELANHGLIQKVSANVYRITDDGEAYLAGELDTAELEDEPAEGGEDEQETQSKNTT